MTTIVPFVDTIKANGSYFKRAPANTAYSPIDITVNVPTTAPTINITQCSMPSQQIYQTWASYLNNTTTYINMPRSYCLLDLYTIDQITYATLAINSSTQPTRYYPYKDNASEHRILVFNTKGATQSNPYPFPPIPELTFISDQNIPVVSVDVDIFTPTTEILTDTIALHHTIFNVSQYPTLINLD